MRSSVIIALFAAFAYSPKTETQESSVVKAHSTSDSLLLQLEEMKYLKNIKRLTFGGNNAEAYWSFDDIKLVFQSDYFG
jgi:hypothetical protein